jgi:hypothetical protein
MLRADNSFGIEGYLAMFVGQKLPYRKKHRPSPAELNTWEKHRAEHDAVGRRGYTVSEGLGLIRRPDWRW